MSSRVKPMRLAPAVPKDMCAHFGCGRELTYREKLFGNKCIKHNGEKSALIFESYALALKTVK